MTTADPLAAAAADARNPVLSLIALTRRLIEVITEENTLIKARRPLETTALVAEKGRLAAAYAEEMQAIRKRGGAGAIASAEDLRQLKADTGQFHALLEEHRRLIERARAITEGILKAVGEDIARQNRPAQGYGKNAVPVTARQALPATLTLNEVI